MGARQPADQHAGHPLAQGVRATYDAISSAYDEALRDELDGKPLDRALLDALVELAGEGTIADVGCGPGHVTKYLADRHPDVVGIDLSPAMIAIAREHSPDLSFTVGSMLQIPVDDDAWAGAIALYSIIHLSAGERSAAFGELARALRPGGWLMVAFHVDSADFAMGEVNHLTDWFGEAVDIDGYFLDPAEIEVELAKAGFAVRANLMREPAPDVEYPSRRCYLLAQRG